MYLKNHKVSKSFLKEIVKGKLKEKQKYSGYFARRRDHIRGNRP